MPIFSTAIKAPGPVRLKSEVVAAITKAVLPTAVGALILWLVPGGTVFWVACSFHNHCGRQGPTEHQPYAY